MLLFFQSLDGDEHSVMADLYNEYYKKMLYMATKILSEPHEAQDCVSNTFMVLLRLYRKSPERLSEPKSTRTRNFVMRIAYHQALELLEKKKRVVPTELDDSVPSTEHGVSDILDLKETYQQIYNALLEMPEKYKSPLILHYYHEMTIPEIADALNITKMEWSRESGQKVKIFCSCWKGIWKLSSSGKSRIFAGAWPEFYVCEQPSAGDAGNRHYDMDMVFYNKILKAYVLISLKIGQFQPEHIGQNMYLYYYDAEVNDEGDQRPIGIVLCTDKHEVMAEFALGGLENNIFALRYAYYIPDKEQLIHEVKALLVSEDTAQSL